MAMASALRRLSCSSSRTRPFLWSSLCYMSSLPSEGRTRRKKSQVTVVDPENADIIELEKVRQWKGRELIPSDDFLSVEMTHNIMTPYDGARLYGGIEYIDMAELVSQNRALQSFGLDPEKWGVNVQSLCGPSPNFVAYTALLKPHERILALDRPDAREEPPQAVLEKMSAVSAFFEKMPYKVARSSTGDLDYDELVKRSTLFRPKLIVAAVGSFIRRSRNEYAPLRKVCDKHKAILLVDMMDKSGLVLTGILASPFKYADIVTTTTHNFIESLLRGGPRGNIIFFKKGVKEINKQGKEVLYDFEDKINQAVSLAVALKQATTPDHKAYQEQVLSNCARFAQILVSKGYELVSGGTESHFVVVDLKNKGINGTKVEAVLRLAHFPVNKWHVPGDVCDKIHGGIRMETLSLTSRGFVEEDFAKVADLFDAAVNLALKIQKIARGPTLWNFKLPTLINEDVISEISQLCHDVEEYAAQFPTIGFEKETMKNKE